MYFRSRASSLVSTEKGSSLCTSELPFKMDQLTVSECRVYSQETAVLQDSDEDSSFINSCCIKNTLQKLVAIEEKMNCAFFSCKLTYKQQTANNIHDVGCRTCNKLALGLSINDIILILWNLLLKIDVNVKIMSNSSSSYLNLLNNELSGFPKLLSAYYFPLFQ